MLTSLPELKSGVYRHYKNHFYLVMGYAHDANYEDRDLVLYVGLELDSAKPGPRLSVRTVEDFFAWVSPDGSTVNSLPDNDADRLRMGLVRRFTYIGPSWDGE